MRRVHKSYNMLALEIHAAVASGDAEIVSDLLKAGASVDKQDDFGNTPLHRAAWQGDRQIVQTLLQHGADAAAQRQDGATPLDLVQLRARGGGDRPPQGLSVEAFRGDIQGVSRLLSGRRSRIDTEGQMLAATQEPLKKSASFSEAPIRRITSFSEMCFLALNELTTSTCASEGDMPQDHMEVLAQTFECMAANIPG